MGYPEERPRRLRATPVLRRLTQEVRLDVSQLVYPLFVVPGRKVRRDIPELEGAQHLSPDEAAEEVRRLHGELGLSAYLLFGLPPHKDPQGSSAYADDGPVQEAVRAIREACPDVLVITDVCLCEYTDHGHCGLVRDGRVENDPTLPVLARVAVSHARAGAHLVAPSDMMDGRVGVIRHALDQAGYEEVGILSYAVKYASAFYGPFREAAGSAPSFGDRRGYQMHPPNVREALREVRLDLQEGADMVMVKPAHGYLDVIRAVREQVDVPVAAYHVSGEYMMLVAAARQGLLDFRTAAAEVVLSIRRAGADVIVTYLAPQLAEWLSRGPLL